MAYQLPISVSGGADLFWRIGQAWREVVDKLTLRPTRTSDTALLALRHAASVMDRAIGYWNRNDDQAASALKHIRDEILYKGRIQLDAAITAAAAEVREPPL